MKEVSDLESYQFTGEVEEDRQIHECPDCSSDWVYPIHWKEEGYRHWRIWLLCPECDHREEVIADQPQTERLDDELDRGSSALLGDLRRMVHANMKEEIEIFAGALAANAILPEDFGTTS